ncbi:MAG: TIGR02281 family clan AA aspartic protease [Deltaproteobacteria bacterium]
MSRILAFGIALVVSLEVAVCSRAAEEAKKTKPAPRTDSIPADAKARLEEAGLKVTTGGVTLPEEVELGKSIREAAKQKKAMMAADREVYAIQQQLDEIKAQIGALKAQHKNLSAQLANVTDVATNNRIVGALNATVGEIEELGEKSKDVTDRLKEARNKAGEIRDEFVQELQTMRAHADEIPQKWSALAADSAVKDAIAAVNKALGKKFALQPTSSFAANVKQLKTMEEAVKSDLIKLENETNSLWVNVMINDKHKKRMIVDSGATTISLSDKMARDMGIKPDANGTPVRVSLADGRVVPATMVKLDSVQVGKFTVQDVECCVLSPEAPDAPPLLGMSFLGQFKFEVDTAQGELKLLKVDSGEPLPKDKAKDKGKSAKKKK